MGWWNGFTGRVMAAISAFKKPVVTYDYLDSTQYDDYDSRRLRYAILWSFFENTAYDNIHKWAIRYKVDYGLYKYLRNIYNPANRLGNFWQTHLMGGYLDPMAGDGDEKVSALPIVTENELLRPAIAKVWEWSNWQSRKGIYTLKGATLGDVGLKIIDNPEKQKAYISVVSPEKIKDYTVDDFGNVKSYVLEEERPNPLGKGNAVTFNEVAVRGDGDDVDFATFLNGKPFPWNGESSEWTIPYGFVPFVVRHQIDVGTKWGWAEMHAARSKIHEVDDLASKTDDQIRKTVDPVWLFAGVKDPNKKGNGNQIKIETPASSTDQPMPGRETKNALYSTDSGAKAQALVADLDLSAVTEQIQKLNEALEKEYPELRNFRDSGGDASGKARRIERQDAETKVLERRVGYDTGLVHAHNMCIAIAGERNYDEAFASFDLDSFEKGDLQHSIGRRPVFSKDKTDDLENNDLFWSAAIKATKSGMSLPAYLESQGWTDEQILKATRTNRRENGNDIRQRLRNSITVDSDDAVVPPPDEVIEEEEAV
jgi:hypothetical protein